MSMLGAADLNLFSSYLIGKGQQNPLLSFGSFGCGDI